MDTLTPFLDTLDFSGKPEFTPTYCREHDFIIVFKQDVPHYSCPVDDHLTVIMSELSNEIVGFRLDGICELAQREHVVFDIDDQDDDEKSLRLLFMALEKSVKTPTIRKYYKDIGKVFPAIGCRVT